MAGREDRAADVGSPPAARWRTAAGIATLTVLLGAGIELVVRSLGLDGVMARAVSRKLYPVPEGEEEGLFATRIFDPVVQWRLRPNAWLPGRISRINTDGLIGREIAWTKRPDRRRLLTLGDSVTYGVWACGYLKMCRDRPYPTALEVALWTHAQNDRWELVNGAVYGHNSTQGLRYWRTRLATLDPDIVTVMFGWNDASAVIGREGRELHQPIPRAIAHATERLATYRTLAGLFAFASLSGAGTPQFTIDDHYVPRTTLDEFRWNLRQFVDDVRGRGGRVLFITEPAGPLSEPYRTGEIPVPWELYRLRTYDEMLARHAEYNAATRAAGVELGVPVVDADAEFARHDVNTLFHPYDMIHPNAAGYRIIADLVFARLRAEGWLDDTAATDGAPR